MYQASKHCTPHLRDDDLDDDGDDGYNGYSDDESDDDALIGIVVQ